MAAPILSQQQQQQLQQSTTLREDLIASSKDDEVFEDYDVDDPFSISFVFNRLLESLSNNDNVSQSWIVKVASYACLDDHKPHASSLFDCIKDRLKEEPSCRLAMLYVMDQIFQFSLKAAYRGYLDLLKDDLEAFFELVVPDENSTASHITGAQKIINRWKSKNVFAAEELEPIEKRISAITPLKPTTSSSNLVAGQDKSSSMSKEDILKKIEEDRDRHKRAREDGWYRVDVTAPSLNSRQMRLLQKQREEFEELWEIIPEMNERDWDAMVEDEMRFKVSRLQY